MDAKYGDKAVRAVVPGLGLSLRLPRRRGSGAGTAIRRTICALLAFALLVFLPLRSISGRSSSALPRADCGPVATESGGDEPAPANLRSLVGEDGHLDDRRFTVLLNTFKRRDLLKKAVAHYATCENVAEIRVVWSEQVSPPTRGEENGAYFGPKPSMVTYDTHPTTSIQNRFDPPSGSNAISTRAVFNVDDDVRMPCAALTRGFDAWRANRDVLVGYYPRTHKPDDAGCGWRYVWDDFSLWRHGDFSIVLTKAAFMRTGYMSLYSEGLPQSARRYIDEYKNCEDIAMQILTAKITGKPPVYVPVPTMHYLWAKLEGFGVAGISKGSGHHVHRGECITDLSRMIGGGGPSSTPLVRAPLQAWRG